MTEILHVMKKFRQKFGISLGFVGARSSENSVTCKIEEIL